MALVDPQMRLESKFDAVIMLTWSDWKTEPRSNRYHYATRFARTLPVLFLQHGYATRQDVLVEAGLYPNIDIVQVCCGMRDLDVAQVKRLLDARGIKRPLLWIYDPINYSALIEALPAALRCYHATEDYFTSTKIWNHAVGGVGGALISLLKNIDFLVACSGEVATSYVSNGMYGGPHAVIENGCDAGYFLERASAIEPTRKRSGRPVAIFQGGINQRLDYDLLSRLIRSMRDWDFQFCGGAVPSAGWQRVLKESNVQYLGNLAPDDFTRHMCLATVGIMPFIQDRLILNSFPLKAFEYVACGLPVVTVPILSLDKEPRLFATARSASEFEAAIRLNAASRDEPTALEYRRRAALANSYDSRFDAMSSALLTAKNAKEKIGNQLRVALLYDGVTSMHVNTIREHVESFEKYSKHSIFYIPATPAFWRRPSADVFDLVDFSGFDVVILHYSIRVSLVDHFEEGLAQALQTFGGLKILFVQDEYEGTEIARQWMDRLRFDLVYTCVPPDGRERIYPPYRFPGLEFVQTLTGYVPEDPSIDGHARPLSERSVLIGYRGRKLPAVYGALGQEKYSIGIEVKAAALKRGLAVDIEVDDSHRIYGVGWYQFLGSVRATLGTESGANVFDVDGWLKKEIAELEAANPAVTFDEISAKVLGPHEGLVQMNQISPKVFEAIRLRTALVLFEGTYSGVVRPHEHYIPLKKDYSNIDEVFEKLNDDAFVDALTTRAYQDIVASGRFSYKTFVEGVDTEIERRIVHENSKRLLQGPLFIARDDGSLTQALPAMPFGASSGPHPLGRPMSLAEMSGRFSA
ncbi:MAG: glycosyltransferase, partial [Nitrospirota bacterium]